jgi:uncharacterized protein
LAEPHLPELGVGIVYSSAIEPLLEADPELFQVLEVEPQTTWIETGEPDEPYVMRAEILAHLTSLPGRKLIHSVGTPVGGSVRANAAQLPLLRQAAEAMDVPWASEHMSFNLTEDFFTGFFLPPRQTEAGIAVYAEAITDLRRGLGVPLAVETGVNYLKPRADEVPDGAFLRRVVETADCGILLDLHNIYCNQLNGRQTIEQFLGQIPLDRVWEVHLAGGFEMDGFWLDAHSGAIPPPLLEICRGVIPSLPNLKAIMLEVFSSFLPGFGLDATRQEIEKLAGLWQLRRPASAQPMRRPPVSIPSRLAAEVSEWESALGNVVVGRSPTTRLEDELDADPGAQLVKALIKEFRASMVVAVYRLTSRLLMLALGPDVFRAFLEDFWAQEPPRQFAGSEGDAFIDYIVGKGLRLPQLQSILAFERASLATLRDGETRIVHFDVDPLPMLRALADGVLLDNPGEPGNYEIEIVVEGPVRITGVDADAVSQTVPYH